MTPLRHLLVALVLLATVLVAPVAKASHDSSDSWNLPSYDYGGLAVLGTTIVVGGGLYVFGGTATFLILDTVYAGKKRPLPLGLAVTQTIYGGTLIAVGAAFAANPNPGLGIGLVAIGGTVATIPLAAFTVRVFRHPVKTAFHLQATGARLTGTF